MILKNENSYKFKTSKNPGILLKAFLVLSLFFIAIYFFSTGLNYSVNTKNTGQENITLISDAEVVSGNKFVFNKFKVDGASGQSSDYSFDGKYSLKLSKDKIQYGFNYEIDEIKQGDYLRVQVWTYSPKNAEGFIVLKSKKEGEFYEQTSIIKKRKGDWGLLEIEIIIPSKISNDKLMLYCYTNSTDPIYFDNLSFQKLDSKSFDKKRDEIKIHINEGDFGRLKAKRNEALEKGILMTESDSWVDAAIYPKNDKEEKIKIKMRLKGDWLDHLQGDKWSFRISTETAKSWNRLKVFSLQTPGTRSFIKEWLLHQFYKNENVLTTRYDFIAFTLNNKKMGLYSYEEHFTKQIPEYNLKREGPIIKFSESSLWESRLQAKQLNLEDKFSEEKISPDIQPFGEKKTAKSPSLSAQFEIAQNLLYEYQYKLKKASEIFDVDLIAKYYAIADITGGHHGIIWHNQRFYYNPIVGKLEPIGFDGYTETGESWLYPAFLGMQESVVNSPNVDKQSYLFLDNEFLKKYYFYLDKYSNENYLSAFIDKVRPDLIGRYQMIMQNYPDYRFNLDFLYNRAKKIRFFMLPTSESLHLRKVNENTIAVCNKHNTALEIIGTSSSDGANVNEFKNSIIVLRSPNDNLPDYSTQFDIPATAKYIVYKVPGLNTLYYAPLSMWTVPKAFTPVQELQPTLKDGHVAYHVDKENKKVIFKSATISDPIVIPSGYSVIFEAGTQLDLIKKAFLVSYSPVFFYGTEDSPILVNSSDKSANGFTVIKAGSKSELNFVTFSDFNTLSYKGWNLTGAVTFYESDVEILNSTFTKNHCEDALNIVRANFKFYKSTISLTYGDGFDSDFCIGIVDKSYFYKTGNDGIDFSTSNVSIQNTIIKNVGDKGISIGENGTAEVINTKIDGAEIGIASKDLSKVTIRSMDLINCKIGFAAYQKKPEYGGGNIYVESYSANSVQKLFDILPGSYMKLLSKEILGNNL